MFFYHAIALEAAAVTQPLHDLHQTDLAANKSKDIDEKHKKKMKEQEVEREEKR